MFCYNCGSELEEKMKFCPECGTPVRKKAGKAKGETPPGEVKKEAVKKKEFEETEGPTKKCPHCSEIIPAIAVRCRNCGADVRDKDALLAKRDAWAPVAVIVLVIAFFLPWVTAGSGYSSRSYSAVDFFDEAGHPVPIAAAAGLLAVFIIIIYLGQLEGGTGGYRARGILSIILGLGWLIYAALIYSAIADSSDASVGIGFILTVISCLVLIMSGFATSTTLSSSFRKAVYEEKSLCHNCGMVNDKKAAFCRKCGEPLAKKEIGSDSQLS